VPASFRAAVFAALAAGAAFVRPLAVSPAVTPCTVSAVFAQVRAATGGSAWNAVGEIAASGTVTSSGLRGVAVLRYDLRHGRYAVRLSLPVAGTSDEVYDGRTVWSRDISGGVHPYDSWYPRARAVTDAYIARRGYLDPHATASFACLGRAKDGQHQTELVRVQPRDGMPAVLSIDTRSHLLDSVTIRTPTTTDVTTFADYRQASGLVLPFTVSSGTVFEPANSYKIDVTRYVISDRVAASDFRKPLGEQNARMLGRALSTAVPVMLEGRQLMVWASIDGHSPMPFILDTGGHAILDTVAAHMLGLQGAGAGVSGGAGAGTIALQYTRVASVRIGGAVLVNQPFLIIPYPYSFYERGKRAPLAGILGLEWFERYAIRIDYAHRSLTLTPLGDFRYRGRGVAVPIRFQEDMPLARAAADGHAGSFGVDTGNASLLILYGDFLRRSGLLAKYAQGYTVRGEGTGGGNTGWLETLSSFVIGEHDMRNLAADFTQMKTGSFSSWTEAGDLGLTVLSRFTPTFDYAKQVLYLDSASHPFVVLPNRSGLGFTKNEPAEFDVVAVRPHSAAAAIGIVAGDRILAVNGKDATDLSSADLLDVVTAAAGTAVQLTVRHATTTRNIRLILR
jgi:PDZ domain/Aspartyl protease